MVFDSTQIRNNELLVIFDTTQKRKDDNFGNSMNTQNPKNQSSVEFQLWIWIFYSVFFPTFWILCKRHEQLLEHTLNQWPAFMNLFRSLQRCRASFLSVLELAGTTHFLKIQTLPPPQPNKNHYINKTTKSHGNLVLETNPIIRAFTVK